MDQKTTEIQSQSENILERETKKQNTSMDQQSHTQKKEIPEELKLYAHLKTYPIANSWIRIAHWVSMPRVIRPYLYQLAFSGPVKEYTIMVDNFVDEQVLGSLDNAVPQVKTLRMRDIRDFLTGPFTRTYELTRGILSNSLSTTDRMALEPARLRIHETRTNLRNRVNEMSSRTRPVVLSRVNPVVKPLNKDLAKYINQMDPKNPIDNKILEDQDNELLNTVKIMNEGLDRTKSIASTRLDQLRIIPANASKRISEVYHESQAKRGDQNNSRVIMLIASLDTVRALANDGYKFLRSGISETTGSTNTILDNDVPPEL